MSRSQQAHINENNLIVILRIRKITDRDGKLNGWMWSNDPEIIKLFKIDVKSAGIKLPGTQELPTLQEVLDILTGMSYRETRFYQDYELPLESGAVREQIKVFHKEILVNQMENLAIQGVNDDDDDVA